MPRSLQDQLSDGQRWNKSRSFFHARVTFAIQLFWTVVDTEENTAKPYVRPMKFSQVTFGLRDWVLDLTRHNAGRQLSQVVPCALRR